MQQFFMVKQNKSMAIDFQVLQTKWVVENWKYFKK